MRYTLAVGTEHGAELLFPHYGEHEYLTVVAICRHESGTSSWAEVREDGEVLCRYIRGRLTAGSTLAQWQDDRMSHRPHTRYLHRTGDERWP